MRNPVLGQEKEATFRRCIVRVHMLLIGHIPCACDMALRIEEQKASGLDLVADYLSVAGETIARGEIGQRAGCAGGYLHKPLCKDDLLAGERPLDSLATGPRFLLPDLGIHVKFGEVSIGRTGIEYEHGFLAI